MATLYHDDTAWKEHAKTLDGKMGAHARLVAHVTSKGFNVEPDETETDVTFIARPGSEHFGHRVIGEIRGKENAVLRIMVQI